MKASPSPLPLDQEGRATIDALIARGSLEHVPASREAAEAEIAAKVEDLIGVAGKAIPNMPRY
ncbi:hypothetical protein [Amycolatopsis sp.]|uniref:hypothetical protein n=1 Tax=Amycolatopsis sp. TaxID=37632 RepID=UPI002D80DC3B|nr:hypothetical protein [Amycolatopsis sp.]HET6710631.1 hypothetical protein [Amycolatopsis sp.]